MTVKEQTAPIDFGGYPSKHAVAMVLPLPARKALVEAAAISPLEPIGQSTIRTRALDAVIARVKEDYPYHFTKEILPNTPFQRFTVPSFMDRSHK